MRWRFRSWLARSRRVPNELANRGPDPDHRPEPPGSVRSSGVAGVPDLAGRRIPGGRDLPEGPGRSRLRRTGRSGAVQVSPLRLKAAEWRRSSSSTSTRSWPRYGWPSKRDEAEASPPSRAATHPISSGRSACSSAACMDPALSSTTTTCARRHTKAAFPGGSRALHRALRFLERRTVRAADHVISTNESYRAVVMERHGVQPDHTTVVRTGPDPARLRPGAQTPACGGAAHHLVAYIGVMGPQDGVNIVLEVADLIINQRQRKDISLYADRIRRLLQRTGRDARPPQSRRLRRVHRPGPR